MAGSHSARTLRRRQVARGILAVLIVALGFWLRVAPIGVALPYLRYIDEGHVLHDAIAMVRSGKFDTGFYNYPALPSYLIAGAFLAYAPVYGLLHGESFWSDLQRHNDLAS